MLLCHLYMVRVKSYFEKLRKFEFSDSGEITKILLQAKKLANAQLWF